MYAVIETGGKQYKVESGDVIAVESLEGKIGDKITIKEVLLTVDGEELKVGNPNIAGAKVLCEVVSQGKGKKLISFKFNRRKGYENKRGHRQLLTRLRVKEIIASS